MKFIKYLVLLFVLPIFSGCDSNGRSFTNDIRFLKSDSGVIEYSAPIKSGGYFQSNNNSYQNMTPDEVHDKGQKEGYEQGQKDRESGNSGNNYSNSNSSSGNYYNDKYNEGYQEGYTAGASGD